jgi:hypothetical protein
VDSAGWASFSIKRRQVTNFDGSGTPSLRVIAAVTAAVGHCPNLLGLLLFFRKVLGGWTVFPNENRPLHVCWTIELRVKGAL